MEPRTLIPRIAPEAPPYSSETAQALAKWMPPGVTVPPLGLFRTLVRHPALSERIRPLGSFFLGRATIPMRARELLVLRTCARCGAEYEWGVHVTAFAAAATLDDALARATAAAAIDPSLDEGDALLLRLADELHDTGTVSDPTFRALGARFSELEILEMTALVGFYHLISFVANAAHVELEPWAARFPA